MMGREIYHSLAICWATVNGSGSSRYLSLCTVPSVKPQAPLIVRLQVNNIPSLLTNPLGQYSPAFRPLTPCFAMALVSAPCSSAS
jgi:hypothetical protein